MKSFIKNIYLIFFLILSLLFVTAAFGKDKKIKYSKHNISNYFSGITSISGLRETEIGVFLIGTAINGPCPS